MTQAQDKADAAEAAADAKYTADAAAAAKAPHGHALDPKWVATAQAGYALNEVTQHAKSLSTLLSAAVAKALAATTDTARYAAIVDIQRVADNLAGVADYCSTNVDWASKNPQKPLPTLPTLP